MNRDDINLRLETIGEVKFAREVEYSEIVRCSELRNKVKIRKTYRNWEDLTPEQQRLYIVYGIVGR